MTSKRDRLIQRQAEALVAPESDGSGCRRGYHWDVIPGAKASRFQRSGIAYIRPPFVHRRLEPTRGKPMGTTLRS